MSDNTPEGLDEFLERAGWAGSQVEPLAGDASFRRYFRIRDSGRSAMLMDAPPPHEDPGPFLDVGAWLARHGHRAPAVHAEDRARGLVLLEDFGNDRMRDWLDDNPQAEIGTYTGAVDALVRLHNSPPGPFPAYDMGVYQSEAALLPEWYAPAAGLVVDAAGYAQAWEEVLAPMLPRQQPGVTVLRDYHAENIMLLPGGEQGLIDFQDALVGHPAYDLVSLLQDARRDVSPELEQAMLDHYLAQIDAGPGYTDQFAADYARLGAQRNAKIVGIFTRLWKRDGKPRYLSMIPRVWQAMERDLAHPALAPVAQWFAANVPPEVRENGGGKLL